MVFYNLEPVPVWRGYLYTLLLHSNKLDVWLLHTPGKQLLDLITHSFCEHPFKRILSKRPYLEQQHSVAPHITCGAELIARQRLHEGKKKRVKCSSTSPFNKGVGVFVILDKDWALLTRAHCSAALPTWLGKYGSTFAEVHSEVLTNFTQTARQVFEIKIIPRCSISR